MSRLEAALRRDTAGANCDGRGRCYEVTVQLDGRHLFSSSTHDLTPGAHRWLIVPSIRATWDGPPEIQGKCEGVFEVTSEPTWLAFRAKFSRDRNGAFRIHDCELSDP